MFYSQNGEDKKIVELLEEYFDGVPENGFYVDVGCWEPELHSVTKYFYDRGWSGINVDPVEEYVRQISIARVRDVNLLCGVSDKPAELSIYVFPHTGISTFRKDYADRYTDTLGPMEVRTVPVRTLSDILDVHLPLELNNEDVYEDIQFLKIDVEGWEYQALKGMDFEVFRPKIVVVEATVPLTNEPNWEKWEPLLFAAKYRFVHFDSLNRFYVRR
jgi:FkbM family methyltransferase